MSEESPKTNRPVEAGEPEDAEEIRTRRWSRRWLIVAAVLFFTGLVAPLFVTRFVASLGAGGATIVIYVLSIGFPVAALAAAIAAAAGRRRRWAMAWSALAGVPIGVAALLLEIVVIRRPFLGLLWLPLAVVGAAIIGYLIDATALEEDEDDADAERAERGDDDDERGDGDAGQIDGSKE